MSRRPHSRFFSLYAAFITSVGIGALAISLPSSMPDDILTYMLLMLMAVIAHSIVLKIGLLRINVSMTFIAIAPAIYLFGAPAAALVAVVAYLCMTLIRGGGDAQRMLFAAGQYCVTILCAGNAYELVLRSSHAPQLPTYIAAASALVLTSIVVNHVLVNIAMLLFVGPHPNRWKHALKWDMLSYMITVPMAVIVTVAVKLFGLTGLIGSYALVFCALYLIRTIDEMERMRRALSVFYENALEMSLHTGTDAVFRTLKNSIEKVLDTCLVAVYLDTGETGELTLVYAHPEAATLPRSISSTEGMIGSVACGAKPLRVKNAMKPQIIEAGGTKAVKSALLLPFSGRRGIVLVGGSRYDQYNDRDLYSVSILVEQASVSLRNALEFEQAQELARTDPMTGLYNYRHFVNCFNRQIDRAQTLGESVGLLYMDIDGLREVNNKYGHLAGDSVLKELAALYKSMLRKGDVVARYGGDEFCMLLPGCDTSSTLKAAERLKAAIDKWSPSVDLGGLKVGVSIGAASYPEDGADIASLIGRADERMFQDKAQAKKPEVSSKPREMH